MIVVVLAGLVLGSFATALSWRVPRGQGWIVGGKGRRPARSACPHCNEPLKPGHLVPLFSWLFLRGRCAFCAKGIGVRYPLTELVTMCGCIGVYMVWGFTVPAFILMVAVSVMAALIVIDFEHMILPDQLIAILVGLAVFLIIYQIVIYGFGYGFGTQMLMKLSGMAVFGGVAWFAGYLVGAVLKKEALGMGDVKFFAMAGLWLGVYYLPFFLIFSGVCGIFLGLFYKIVLKKQLFPFGPALIVSLYAALLLQGLEIVPFLGVQ